MNDDSISLVDFVNDLLNVCRTYKCEELFTSYIMDFIRDMRAQGLIYNDKDIK